MLVGITKSMLEAQHIENISYAFAEHSLFALTISKTQKLSDTFDIQSARN